MKGENWVGVSNLYNPTWTHTNTDEWIYTFSGLPSYDSNGAQYEYRVREEVPDGYALENHKTSGDTGEVDKDATTGHYDFTNVLSGKVTITGTKNWSGGVGSTPDLTLYRRLSGSTEETSWTPVSDANPTWSNSTFESTQWIFTYSNLDKYDGDGVLYEYQVREAVPDGYEAGYTAGNVPATITGHPATSVYGLTITNYKDGSLEVSKTVSGNRGETDREFHFTVTLTGTSAAGTQATSITDTFTTSRTDAQGNSYAGTIQFTNGVSAEFTLKHNESLTIQGLPAGIGYTVTETEANQESYTTTGTGNTGVIPVGETAQAAFDNYRHSSSSSNRTDVSGTKTWVGDTAGQRPATLELKLYRSVDGGAETLVNATPGWTKNGSVWTYRYANLPKYDGSGRTYTYRVEEVVPAGYVSAVNGKNFTNTHQKDEAEKVTLSGVKHWVGDTAASRPASVTVVLYDGSGQEVGRTTISVADGWSYTFRDMPKYDAEGKEIAYYVREETVPAGYDVQYDGLNITNRKTGDKSSGSLRISKQVTGEGADQDRQFTFTLTLSDKTVNGTYGDLKIVGGIAVFTLKHGQAIRVSGLPTGLTYTVSETAAEGYTSSGTNPMGTITEGAALEVRFTNTYTPEGDGDKEPGDSPDDPNGQNDEPDGQNEPGTTPDPDAGPDADVPRPASWTEGSDQRRTGVPTGDNSRSAPYVALLTLFTSGLLLTLRLGRKSRKAKNVRKQNR